MKHLYSFVFALVALVAANVVQAQGPNQINPNCVGLKNPTNFTLSGTHDELWTGYTGNKGYMVSTCLTEGSTYNQTVQASNLETYNNTNGCTISLETNARTTSKDLYNNLDHSMVTSFETVKNILSGTTDKTNIWNVNTEKEYHEENK